MERMQKFIKLIGYVLTLVSLGYIVGILTEFDLNSLHFKNPIISFLYILLFGIWASLFVLIGAYNWKLILEFVNGTPLPAKDISRVYLQSNIAKYLPGNVLHYAGRNYLGSKLGWKNSEMAFSSLLEYLLGFGLTGIIIIIFAALGLVHFPSEVSFSVNYNEVLGYTALVTAGVIFFICGYRFFVSKEEFSVTSRRIGNRVQQFFSLRFMVLSLRLFLLSLFSFIMNCFLFYYLCTLVLDFNIRHADFFNAVAALYIANYMSILTPGVPGGLGIRESVSILLISAYGYPKESLVISMLLVRLVNVLGDVLPFLVVTLFKKNESCR